MTLPINYYKLMGLPFNSVKENKLSWFVLS